MENVAPGQQLADTRLPSMDCTRPSLEAFNALPSRPGSAAAQQHKQQQRAQNARVAADPQAAGAEGLLSLCALLGVQANMQQALARLAAVARDLPVPMRMLVTLSGSRLIEVAAVSSNMAIAEPHKTLTGGRLERLAAHAMPAKRRMSRADGNA